MNASRPRGWRFKVARLAELDMAFLGPRVIVAELRSESPAPSRWALRRLFTSSAWGGAPWSWPTLLGIELVAIGMNYLPLLFEAWRIGSPRPAVLAACSQHGYRTYLVRERGMVPTTARAYTARRVHSS